MSSGKAKSKRYTQLHWAHCGFWEHPKVSLGASYLMAFLWFAWFQSPFPLVKSVGEDSLLAPLDQNSGSSLECPVHSLNFHQGYYCIDKQVSLGETELDMCISNGKARSALGDLKREPRNVSSGQETRQLLMEVSWELNKMTCIMHSEYTITYLTTYVFSTNWMPGTVLGKEILWWIEAGPGPRWLHSTWHILQL